MSAWAMFPATGEFFKVVILTTNAYNKTKEIVSGVATSVVNLFSQKTKRWIVCGAGIFWFNKFRK